MANGIQNSFLQGIVLIVWRERHILKSLHKKLATFSANCYGISITRKSIKTILLYMYRKRLSLKLILLTPLVYCTTFPLYVLRLVLKCYVSNPKFHTVSGWEPQELLHVYDSRRTTDMVHTYFAEPVTVWKCPPSKFVCTFNYIFKIIFDTNMIV